MRIPLGTSAFGLLPCLSHSGQGASSAWPPLDSGLLTFFLMLRASGLSRLRKVTALPLHVASAPPRPPGSGCPRSACRLRRRAPRRTGLGAVPQRRPPPKSKAAHSYAPSSKPRETLAPPPEVIYPRSSSGGVFAGRFCDAQAQALDGVKAGLIGSSHVAIVN